MDVDMLSPFNLSNITRLIGQSDRRKVSLALLNTCETILYPELAKTETVSRRKNSVLQ